MLVRPGSCERSLVRPIANQFYWPLEMMAMTHSHIAKPDEYFMSSTVVNDRSYRMMRIGRGMARPCRLNIDGKLQATGDERRLRGLIAVHAKTA